MAVQSVRVVKPLQQAIVGILANYDPLESVRVGNRGAGTQSIPENHDQPADLPGYSVQFRRARATPHAAETFATLATFNPASPPTGIVRETHEFDITLDTSRFNVEEAADLGEDCYSAFVYAGADLGLSVGGVRVVKGWDANWRVEDIAGGPTDRTAKRGKRQKRVVFTLRVNIELQNSQRMPREVP
jgi:hypothetical protein